MARKTMAQVESELRSEMNAGFDRLEALILARFTPSEPARNEAPAQPKADRKPRQPKADRVVMATSHTFLGERVGTGSRKLTKGNREAFIAAHAWAKPGMSTNTLRSEVAAGRKVNKGWNVAI